MARVVLAVVVVEAMARVTVRVAAMAQVGWEMVVEEMVVVALEVGVQGVVETAPGDVVREEVVAMARRRRVGVGRARAVLAAAVVAAMAQVGREMVVEAMVVEEMVVEEMVVEEMVVEEMVVAASEVGVQGGALRRCRQFH